MITVNTEMYTARIGPDKLLFLNSNSYHFFFITFHLSGCSREPVWHVDNFQKSVLGVHCESWGFELRSPGLAELISRAPLLFLLQSYGRVERWEPEASSRGY